QRYTGVVVEPYVQRFDEAAQTMAHVVRRRRAALFVTGVTLVAAIALFKTRIGGQGARPKPPLVLRGGTHEVLPLVRRDLGQSGAQRADGGRPPLPGHVMRELVAVVVHGGGGGGADQYGGGQRQQQHTGPERAGQEHTPVQHGT